PPPSLLQPLMAQGIGFEVMNTAAACRTYNILASEGRRVVAGLVVSPTNTGTPDDL
ncbi:MAG: MTH938/NDUFAF3 family protein, partial [Thiomonas delicata]